MEFELANCNRFLDVAEFVLLAQRESPMLAAIRREQAPPHPKVFHTRYIGTVKAVLPLHLSVHNSGWYTLSAGPKWDQLRNTVYARQE